MAGTLEKGTSSADVQDLQLKINKIYGKNVVPTDGTYEEKTEKAVGELQTKMEVPVSGKYDANTAKAFDKALLPRKKVEYKGQTYFLSQDEYKEVSTKLIKQLEVPAKSYINMANQTQGLWKAHEQAQKDNVFFSWVVARATGAKFPEPKTIQGAVDAANAMQSALGAGDLDKASQALKNNVPIRDAFAAMDQYRQELYDGSTQLVEELKKIQGGCETTLTICAVMVPGGFVVQAGLAAGLGSYKALLGEIDKASLGDSNQTVGNAFGRILLAGAVEGALAYILKGPSGKAALNSIAGAAVKAATGKAVGKVGKTALQEFAMKSLEAGLEKSFEEFIKDLVKACDPKEKTTAEQAFTNIGKNFAEGAAFKNLEEALGGFAGKAAEKYFKEGAEKFIKGSFKGKIDLDEAFKNGGGKVIEEAYKKSVDAAVKEAPKGDPAQVQKILEKKIVEDPALKKFFADYEKKNAKK